MFEKQLLSSQFKDKVTTPKWTCNEINPKKIGLNVQNLRK